MTCTMLFEKTLPLAFRNDNYCSFEEKPFFFGDYFMEIPVWLCLQRHFLDLAWPSSLCNVFEWPEIMIFCNGLKEGLDSGCCCLESTGNLMHVHNGKFAFAIQWSNSWHAICYLVDLWCTSHWQMARFPSISVSILVSHLSDSWKSIFQ